MSDQVSVALNSRDEGIFAGYVTAENPDHETIWLIQSPTQSPTTTDIGVGGNGFTAFIRNPSIAFDSQDIGYMAFRFEMTAPPGGQLHVASNILSGTPTYEIVHDPNIGQPCDETVTYPELAIDSNDKLHIVAYCHHDTYGYIAYFTNTSGSWVGDRIEGIDNTNCFAAGRRNSAPSLRADSNNKIHVAFADCSENVIKYATNSSGSWVVSDVTSGDSENEYLPRIAVDPTGGIHIVFTSTDGKFFYTQYDGQSWSAHEEILLSASDDIFGYAAYASDLRIQGLRGRSSN